MHCQFGHHYYTEKENKSTRVCVQGTRKIGCKAHIVTREYTLYPDFSVNEDNLTTWNNEGGKTELIVESHCIW